LGAILKGSHSRTLRPYEEQDEDACIALWQRTWQSAYPNIDFAARIVWWRERWRNELVPQAAIVVADAPDGIVGFVTVEPASGYLDQLVVAVAHQGKGVADALLAEARRLSPQRLDLHVNKDNARAIRFYERNGFLIAGEDLNPRSNAPIYLMSWRRDEASDRAGGN
jgi:putative acetyltransferase